jgi:hypothetical protein
MPEGRLSGVPRGEGSSHIAKLATMGSTEDGGASVWGSRTRGFSRSGQDLNPATSG